MVGRREKHQAQLRQSKLARGVRASGLTAGGGRVWAELGHAVADRASVRELPESGGEGSGRWDAAGGG